MEKVKVSTISHKYPSYRHEKHKTTARWLEARQEDDNAEGLWRIHDGLYDLTDFIDKHPGGPDWLKITKGTDITEAFETHHIRLNAEKLLPKFKVREATTKRNYKFTFNDDGFYRTLKRKVRDNLDKLDKSPAQTSKLVLDTLLTFTYLSAILAINMKSLILALVCGTFMVWTVICSHNFFHARDNWRMYCFNLSFFSYRVWRVSHAMSHHLYTNSLHDLEISIFEPFLMYLPDPNIKNIFQRYGSWVYGPVLYSIISIAEYLKRAIYQIFGSKKEMMYWDDLIPFTVPLIMYLTSNAGVFEVLRMWLLIVVIASIAFGIIGLNAAHHHPDILHDGDIVRENLDFGLYQLDSVRDRKDLKGSQFMVLTHFGEHALHHLFPTIDHGILPQLNQIFYETLEQFEYEYSEGWSWLTHIIGQHKQLARIEPSKVIKGMKKDK